jgi:hypothetical protein
MLITKHRGKSAFVALLLLLTTLFTPGFSWGDGFFEGWEGSPVGIFTPTALIQGDGGVWLLDDTVSDCVDECGPTPHRAEILSMGGSKVLRLTSNDSKCSCADNIWVDLSGVLNSGFSVPITMGTLISFEESGSLINPQQHGWGQGCGFPPCYDNISLSVVDNRGNEITYVIQRYPQAVPDETYDMYREIFLDPEGGIYVRNLFNDFSTIPAFVPTNAQVSSIVFEIYEHGSALLDNITIGEEAAWPSVTIKATDSSAAEEGLDTGTFTVTRTGQTGDPLTVVYNVGGSADSGDDYEPLSGSVTIPIGASSAEIRINPVDDMLVENDETVILTLLSNAAYVVGSADHAAVSIADNEHPVGDINDDGTVNLVDSILALQIIVGIKPASTPNPKGDVNEDNRIGIEEVIYALQCAANLRGELNIDNDADGYTENQGDCDDADQDIHPGAVEECNGKDDDCDGQVDEGVTNSYYRDADADGYGNANDTIQGCSSPSGYVTNSTDCDDNNASIHPGANETCGDGIDNNCDGQVDEGCGGTCCSVSQGEWNFNIWNDGQIVMGIEGYFMQSGCNFYLTDDLSFSGPLNGCHWTVQGEGLVIEGDFSGNPPTSFEGTWRYSGNSGRVNGYKM